jgi:hypothetical protein
MQRVRFENGCIAKGGFPAWTYWRSVKDASVELDSEVKGTRADFSAADEKMRAKLKDPKWKQPAGYTWNHAGSPGSRTMELVDMDFHAAVHHQGSASAARAARRVVPGVGGLAQASASSQKARVTTARCVHYFSPLDFALDALNIWSRAKENGNTFREQVDEDLDNSLFLGLGIMNPGFNQGRNPWDRQRRVD